MLHRLQNPWFDPFKVKHHDSAKATSQGMNPKIAQHPQVPRGRILHTHIYPSFARRVGAEEELPCGGEDSSTDLRLLPEGVTESQFETLVFNKEIAVQVTSDETVPGLGARKVLARVSRPFPTEFKKCFTLFLSTPEADPFWHWMLLCTPCNCLSVVKPEDVTLTTNHGTNVSAQEKQNALFTRVHSLLLKTLMDCARRPTQFFARMTLLDGGTQARLRFVECVNGYREQDLFEVELRRTPWELLIADVQGESERLKAQHDAAEGNLINLTNYIFKRYPTMYITSPLSSLPPPSEPPSKSYGYRNYQRVLREKEESLQISKTQESIVKISSRRIRAQIVYPPKQSRFQSDLVENGTEKEEDLVMTVYGKSKPPCSKHDSYIITIHSQQNLFFHFTTKEINKEVWTEMTEQIRPDLDPRSRMKLLGFHEEEGVGGVVGVVVNDFVRNVCEQSERYRATLQLSIAPSLTSSMKNKIRGENSNSKNLLLSALDNQYGEDVDPDFIHAAAYMTNITTKVHPQCPAHNSTASLIFTEDLGIRTTTPFTLEFTSTDQNTLRNMVTSHLSKSRDALSATIERIDTLIKHFRDKSRVEYERMRRVLPVTISNGEERQEMKEALLNIPKYQSKLPVWIGTEMQNRYRSRHPFRASSPTRMNRSPSPNTTHRRPNETTTARSKSPKPKTFSVYPTVGFQERNLKAQEQRLSRCSSPKLPSRPSSPSAKMKLQGNWFDYLPDGFVLNQ